MNISLGSYSEWVEGKVLSGEYSSASEVIRAGLRVLKEREDVISYIRARTSPPTLEGVERRPDKHGH